MLLSPSYNEHMCSLMCRFGLAAHFANYWKSFKNFKTVRVHSSYKNQSDMVPNEPVVMQTIVVRVDDGEEKNNGDGAHQNYSKELRESLLEDEP